VASALARCDDCGVWRTCVAAAVSPKKSSWMVGLHTVFVVFEAHFEVGFTPEIDWN